MSVLLSIPNAFRKRAKSLGSGSSGTSTPSAPTTPTASNETLSGQFGSRKTTIDYAIDQNSGVGEHKFHFLVRG